jgi:hypothetical protein
MRDHAAKSDAEIARLQDVLAQQSEWDLQLRDHAAKGDAEIPRLQEVLAAQANWNLQLRRQLTARAERAPWPIVRAAAGLLAVGVRKLQRVIRRSPDARVER